MAATEEYLIKIQLQVQNDKALQRVAKEMGGVATANTKMQKSLKKTQVQMRQSGRGLQNVSYQLQDIIVQTSGGVDVFRSLSQQLPQMLINMGAFGAVVGVVAAGLPLLVSAMKGAGEEALSLSDALDQLSSTANDIGSVSSGADLSGWIKAWNEATEAVRESQVALLEYQLTRTELALSRAAEASALEAQQNRTLSLMDKLRAAGEIAAGSGDASLWNISYLENLKWIYDSFADSLGFMGETFNHIAESTEAANGPMERLGELYGLNAQQASFFNDMIERSAELTEEEINVLIRWASNMDVGNEAMRVQIDRMREMLKIRQDLARVRQIAADPPIMEGDRGKPNKEQQAQADAMSNTIKQMGDLQGVINSVRIEYNDWLQLQREGANESITLAENTEKVVESWTLQAEAMQLFERSFNTMLDGVLMGTQSIADGFRDMAKVVIAQMLKMLAYKAIANAFGPESAIGSMFVPSAKGNAFNNGSVVPFANGGIVKGPTVFPMKNGMGLMGEAGPEAVMPLKRGSDGKLGVSGGGMNVTINNMAQGVEVNTRQGENGLTVDILMRQLTQAVTQGGNDLSTALENTYSLGRGRAVY
jgi:lambda family phage tail tape measure protein